MTAGLVVPRLVGLYDAMKMDTAVNRIVQSVEYAQAYAVGHNALLVGVFDGEKNEYSTHKKKGDQEELLPGRFGKTVSLPDDISFAHRGIKKMYVYPDGSRECDALVLRSIGCDDIVISTEGYFGEIIKK